MFVVNDGPCSTTNVAETFSDLDEDEIDTYILGQREKDFKERQWQILFADWLAEQEQKKLGMVHTKPNI